MFKFNIDEYECTVLRTADQYNDYSVKYDITLRIKDLDKVWTQTITARGDTLEAIRVAFRTYIENGWIRCAE